MRMRVVRAGVLSATVSRVVVIVVCCIGCDVILYVMAVVRVVISAVRRLPARGRSQRAGEGRGERRAPRTQVHCAVANSRDTDSFTHDYHNLNIHRTADNLASEGRGPSAHRSVRRPLARCGRPGCTRRITFSCRCRARNRIYQILT